MSDCRLVPARLFGPAAVLVVALGWLQPVPVRAAEIQGHQEATAALADLKAAVSEILQADASDSTDRDFFHRASQRAINALEGAHGPDYVGAEGTPADSDGTIGHIDALLDRKGEPVWADPLRGAEANLRVAVSYLQDANKARELMDYQRAVTKALIHIEAAEGRPDDTGVLGGLEGALANTVLGVPAAAQQADACSAPRSAPVYGTHGGYLAWVSLPAQTGDYKLPEPITSIRLSANGNAVVLHTAAAPLVAKQCGAGEAAQPAKAGTVHRAAAATGPTGAAAPGLPALYTEAQALAGKQIFQSRCISCHGVDLQGVAAPAVAGTDFLKTASANDWTVGVIRYIVFTMMPMNAAKSLSPEQYADAMAYLLASNCYPAGEKPFPTESKPELSTVKLAPVPGHPPGQNDKGVCAVG